LGIDFKVTLRYLCPVLIKEHPKITKMSTNEVQSKTLVLVDEFGLNSAQQAAAKNLSEKFPEVVRLGKEVVAGEQSYVEKYLGLCVALRDSGLNGKPMSLLLRSVGFRKQRVTEIKKVISVSPELWSKFVNKVIGFKGVLQIARDGEGGVDNEGGQDGEGLTAAEKAGQQKKKAAALPKNMQRDCLAEIEAAEQSKKDGHKTWIKETGKSPFKFLYESPEYRYVIKMSVTKR